MTQIPRYGSQKINRQAYERLGDLFSVIAHNIEQTKGTGKSAEWWEIAWKCYFMVAFKAKKLRTKKKYYSKMSKILEDARRYVNAKSTL